MKNKKTSKEYLTSFLKIAPLSHALWRAVEALSFDQVDFKAPVLDLGCGFGEFAGVVFGQLEMGIDINKKELNQALKGKKYANVRWADARKLPFSDKSYSTVVSVSVMEHILKPERVLKEVSRVLNKGGIFAFSVPTPEIYSNLLIPKLCALVGLNNLARKYYQLHCKAFKHVNLRSAGWWKKQLEKNGFEVIRLEGTISPTLLKLHELFLISALPSQISKLLFEKRLLMSVGIRSIILPLLFSRFVYLDKKSNINMFIMARKV